MYLQSKTVSPDFRRLLADHYPRLGSNPAYWRLAEHLLFSAITDDTTGKVYLSREQLAAIEGKEKLLANHRYVADQLLTGFSRDVAPIVASPWRYTDGIARTVENDVFAQSVLDAAAAERRRLVSSDRVYFATGRPWTRQTQAEVRQEARAAAERYRNKAPNGSGSMVDA